MIKLPAGQWCGENQRYWSWGCWGRKTTKGLLAKARNGCGASFWDSQIKKKACVTTIPTIFKQILLEKEMEPHLIRDLLNRFPKNSIKIL